MRRRKPDRSDLASDWQEDESRHQSNGVARRPVLARLFVVLLVEAPDQLFENRAHRVVVETRVLHRAVAVQNGIRAEVDVRRKKPFDESAKGISLGQAALVR